MSLEYNIEKKKEYLKNVKNIMVTGGCGFIGSNFLNYMVEKFPNINFHNVDKMDYCANENNIKVSRFKNYFFYKCDINDKNFIIHILNTFQIDTIVHFAAQSHVDNSFDSSLQFTIDNVLGTHTLLDCTKRCANVKKFIHISTDEVYGEVDDKHTGCHEKSILNPTNPYAATKASAEMLVNSYFHSYKLPVIITRGNNVYGPNQYPEKLIPKFEKMILDGKKMTIHGDGSTKRNFVHALDVAKAIEIILQEGEIGEIYNIGTNNEYTVLEIATLLLKKHKPDEKLEDWIEFVPDRPFNDYRYAINSEKLRSLGWKENCPFIL
jgi:UDP-glucose 4,6-dehydratase